MVASIHHKLDTTHGQSVLLQGQMRCNGINRISKTHIQIYIYIYTYILYFTMRHILSNFKHLVQQFARYIYTFHELQISLVIPTTEVHWK